MNGRMAYAKWFEAETIEQFQLWELSEMLDALCGLIDELEAAQQQRAADPLKGWQPVVTLSDDDVEAISKI